jgi:nicotinamidase-related amidase
MLLDADSASLLVIDIQERLASAVADGAAAIDRARLLMTAAARLDVPILVSEQYPEGLGPTVEGLRPLPEQAVVVAKRDFSCARDDGLRRAVEATGRRQLVVCGMETHVCVLQSALGFQAAGLDVFVAADATGSRAPMRRELGLARMRHEGVRIVDSEMVVFEWLGTSAAPAFRELSRLIR